MRTGKGDISGWLGRPVSRCLRVGFAAARLLVVVALLVGLWSWPSVAVAVAAGALRAYRRPRGGGSVLRLCAGVVCDVLLSSVFPYVRPVRRRTLRRAVTLCAGLCVSVAGRRR
ncbi:hypothetical protein [Streptomyces djakartensis]|uniref:hypothetical protein n=1 Tax=Streptomyces djakartensis TaxID=68193 RepID=UPI00167DE07D|nr:hypothetical protein [Streptomyces djakartensis]